LEGAKIETEMYYGKHTQIMEWRVSMEEQRPPIPAELRRRVLVEAGHRCAIPTCRYINVEVHHIVPYSICKKHEYENLIALCPNCHSRTHNGDIDRKSLYRYKANLRYAIEKYSQFEIDVLHELSKREQDKGMLFPEYLKLLIKRLIDSNYVVFMEEEDVDEYGWEPPDISINGETIIPKQLCITEQGRHFLDSLGSEMIGY
jgi:Restriction endonuclease